MLLPTADLPAGTVGVVLEVTTTQAANSGYATVHPGGTTPNNTSTINLTSTSDRAHQVVVALGTGNPVISLRGRGSAQLIADVVGYVVTPGSTGPDPSGSPTETPTDQPTDQPTDEPTATATPTPSPTKKCTLPAPFPCV